MRYFFLIYFIIGILIFSFFGKRGDKFSAPPIQIFPDMDSQDKLKEQEGSPLFRDGIGGRLPLFGTVPKLLEFSDMRFSEKEGYFPSGKRNKEYGSGIPKEMTMKKTALLKRGQERFEIYCVICHGSSGNGQGVISRFGFSGIANLTQEFYLPKNYPDGKIFEVITKGRGNMGGYGHQISIEDRWAIIAYLRSLQSRMQKMKK